MIRRVLAKSEVHAAVAGTGVPYGGGRLVPLRLPVFRGDANCRAERHAVAFSPDESEKDPVIAGIGNVVEELNRSIQYSRRLASLPGSQVPSDSGT